MLAGVPLLRRQRHGRAPALPQPVGYLAAAAHFAVVFLICTNLMQMYYLFTQGSAACDIAAPQQASRQQLVSVTERVSGLKSLLALQPPGARAPAGLPFPGRHFAVFIIYSWNYDIFWTSLQTYMAAGWGRRVIIIDNSLEKLILNDPDVRMMVGEIIPTRVKMSFSQAMNFIADIALEREYTYYFWGHADVALLASAEHKVFAEEVLDCMDVIMEQEDKWGITFFAYDWFSATRTPLVREVLYDTFIPVYMSDCDYYPRVRRNWKTLSHLDYCPNATVHVYDMRRAMRLPLSDYRTTKSMLEGEEVDEGNRNAWKVKEWSLGEHIGWELWEMATRSYFRFKWGLPGEGQADCEVEVEDEDGNLEWRQMPFETVADMLTPTQAASFAVADRVQRRI